MDPWALGGVFGLVTGSIFKIAEWQELSLAGSIPVRLRPRALRGSGGTLAPRRVNFC